MDFVNSGDEGHDQGALNISPEFEDDDSKADQDAAKFLKTFSELKKTHDTTVLNASNALHVRRKGKPYVFHSSLPDTFVKGNSILINERLPKLVRNFPDVSVTYHFENSTKIVSTLAQDDDYYSEVENLRPLLFGVMEMAKVANIRVFTKFDGLNSAVYTFMSYCMDESNRLQNSAADHLAVLDRCLALAHSIDGGDCGDFPNYALRQTHSTEWEYLDHVHDGTRFDSGAYGLMMIVALAVLPAVTPEQARAADKSTIVSPLCAFLETIRKTSGFEGLKWEHGLKMATYLLFAQTEVFVSFLFLCNGVILCFISYSFFFRFGKIVNMQKLEHLEMDNSFLILSGVRTRRP